MANRWTGITVDCRDPAALATSWSAVLNRPISDEHVGPGWATVGSRLDDQPRLTFQAVLEPKTTKVRIHLDVQVGDIDLGRQQVEALGGRWTGDRHGAVARLPAWVAERSAGFRCSSLPSCWQPRCLRARP